MQIPVRLSNYCIDASRIVYFLTLQVMPISLRLILTLKRDV
jgi:hypothetical protein